MSVRFHDLVRELNSRRVRYVLIGVAGANYFATAGSVLFSTQDRDLFLPLEAGNLLLAWQACEAVKLELVSAGEPLDQPRDLWLAEQVVVNRAASKATDGADLEIDLTLTMAGFEFEEVWISRQTFHVGDEELPVARLEHIVRSKATVGRPKDRLFLETHKEALRDLLPKSSPSDPSGAADSA
jgi:hypothetical protein